MKYINANEILPVRLVEELQKYMQAGYLYIPAKTEQHKSWGELFGCRKELGYRNIMLAAGFDIRQVAEITGIDPDRIKGMNINA